MWVNLIFQYPYFQEQSDEDYDIQALEALGMIRTERNAPPDDDLIYDDVSVAAANGGGSGAIGGHSYITLEGCFYTLPRKILLCPINWGTQWTMEIGSNE